MVYEPVCRVSGPTLDLLNKKSTLLQDSQVMPGICTLKLENTALERINLILVQGLVFFTVFYLLTANMCEALCFTVIVN